jgi:hypothetical protein
MTFEQGGIGEEVLMENGSSLPIKTIDTSCKSGFDSS